MVTREKKDRLLSFLFDQSDTTLVNIKFFRGGNEVVSEEDLCHQLHAGFMQKKMGRAQVSERFSDVTHEKIDVRTFVNSI